MEPIRDALHHGRVEHARSLAASLPTSERSAAETLIEEHLRSALFSNPAQTEEEDPEVAAAKRARKEALALEQARLTMQQDVMLLENIQDSVRSSSSTLDAVDTAYGKYSATLASAKQALGALQKSANSDGRVLWGGFGLNVAVVLYIVCRRLGVFWVLSWCVSNATGVLVWLLAYVGVTEEEVRAYEAVALANIEENIR